MERRAARSTARGRRESVCALTASSVDVASSVARHWNLSIPGKKTLGGCEDEIRYDTAPDGAIPVHRCPNTYPVCRSEYSSGQHFQVNRISGPDLPRNSSLDRQ